MSWEETILTEPEIRDAIIDHTGIFDTAMGKHKAVARKQANLAYEAGIRKVVDFVKDNHIIPLCDYRTVGTIRQDEEHREDCRKCKWKAQLKEWGIE